MTSHRSTANSVRQHTALSDPTTVLPRELATEVFRQLDFAGRFAVSHVCSSWRCIALSARRLWAEYRIEIVLAFDVNKVPAAARTLAWLLARSAPLPFRLDCAYDVPDEIAELVVAHIGRMEVLNMGRFLTDDAPRRLLAQDMPLLKRISFSRIPDSGPPLLIPARWAKDGRLQSIGAKCPCFWPPNCAFPALRSFSGFIPQGQGVSAVLSALFPNLRYLSLHGLSQEYLGRLDPLPPSLTALKLRTECQGVDCAALFRGCTTSLLRELTLDCTRSASCVLEVFRLFERTVDGPWALHVYGGIIGLHAPPSGRSLHCYDVFNLNSSWLACPEAILAHCDRLHSVRLGLFELSQLSCAQAVLPALVDAAIVLAGRHEYGLAAALDDRPGIDAPRIKRVMVSLGARLDLDARLAAVLSHVVRAFHAPQLASVVIRGVRPATFCPAGVATLGNLAERVEALDCKGTVVHVFPSTKE